MVSATPLSFMYCTAARMMLRGYWGRGRFSGVSMIMALPVMDRVGMEQKGSMTAVSGSGMKTMSLFSTTA